MPDFDWFIQGRQFTLSHGLAGDLCFKTHPLMRTNQKSMILKTKKAKVKNLFFLLIVVLKKKNYRLILVIFIQL